MLSRVIVTQQLRINSLLKLRFLEDSLDLRSVLAIAISCLLFLFVQRVKVYHMNEDGLQWDDKGTGYVRMDYLEVCSWSAHSGNNM